MEIDVDDLKRLYNAIDKARDEALLLYTKVETKHEQLFYMQYANDLEKMRDEIAKKVPITTTI